MNYLITGGAGFIGSHMADALLARGDRVSILDNLSTGSIENIAHVLDHPGLRFREGSVLDEDTVRHAVAEADAVFHLAASVGVELIVQHPLESLTNNIRGAEVVLRACADHGRRVLVASTSEIYGKNDAGPLREDADRILGSTSKSRWAYSTSKAVDEILAHAYWRDRGTRTVVARLFNCIGPRQTGAYGMVVPRFVRQALTGEPLTVFGSGQQRRSFCHVREAVVALIALLDHPDSAGEVFNVGAVNEVTMNGLARLVIAMTGSSSPLVLVPYDVAYEAGFEDMHRRLPDISKIRALTGWAPAASLEEVVADVIEFERGRLAARARRR
jgi:nucleoside-diphosphate-sugar epimerase